MSCELICCEVNDIILTIVNPTDTSLLDLLFSLLDTEEELDAYSAGYFEKVCFVYGGVLFCVYVCTC